jgi:prostaglandin-endoperoxide synthase 2
MPYNAYRKYVGLPPARSFAEINSDPQIQRQLKELYGTPDRVEFYVGLFAEEKSADAVLPELITKLVAIDAFSQALTNPLLSEPVYKPSTFAEGWDQIQKTTCLRDIVLRNIPEFLGNRDNLRVSMSSEGL